MEWMGLARAMEGTARDTEGKCQQNENIKVFKKFLTISHFSCPFYLFPLHFIRLFIPASLAFHFRFIIITFYNYFVVIFPINSFFSYIICSSNLFLFSSFGLFVCVWCVLVVLFIEKTKQNARMYCSRQKKTLKCWTGCLSLNVFDGSPFFSLLSHTLFHLFFVSIRLQIPSVLAIFSLSFAVTVCSCEPVVQII